MRMIAPPPLKKGDKIGIVTPSGRIEEGVLDNAIERFEEWGLEVMVAQAAYNHFNQFGGTVTERLTDLQGVLNDPEIKAVVCSRGGYGAVKIIDLIDFRLFVASPKWIVGYSDITVLHNHINENYGIKTLHGPMAAELSPERKIRASDDSMELLRETLFGALPAYIHPVHQLSRGGKTEGILTGGNLSVLYSLTGSGSFPETEGRILFIEDVGEYLYHIDRMMVGLRRNGVLEGIGGLLVGGLTDMNDNKVPFGRTAEEIIAEAVEDYDYPVCFGFPAGHQPENKTLIMGSKVTLSVGESISHLTFI